jgi:hypothetical protein
MTVMKSAGDEEGFVGSLHVTVASWRLLHVVVVISFNIQGTGGCRHIMQWVEVAEPHARFVFSSTNKSSVDLADAKEVMVNKQLVARNVTSRKTE